MIEERVNERMRDHMIFISSTKPQTCVENEMSFHQTQDKTRQDKTRQDKTLFSPPFNRVFVAFRKRTSGLSDDSKGMSFKIENHNIEINGKIG